MDWYLKVLTDYAVFKGRARRKEYWMFTLFSTLATFGLMITCAIASVVLKSPLLADAHSLYTLGVLIPSIAVGVRRMHDINRSGWWLLVPIVSLVFLCTSGTKGENFYGPDPKTDGPKPTEGSADIAQAA